MHIRLVNVYLLNVPSVCSNYFNSKKTNVSFREMASLIARKSYKVRCIRIWTLFVVSLHRRIQITGASTFYGNKRIFHRGANEPPPRSNWPRLSRGGPYQYCNATSCLVTSWSSDSISCDILCRKLTIITLRRFSLVYTAGRRLLYKRNILHFIAWWLLWWTHRDDVAIQHHSSRLTSITDSYVFLDSAQIIHNFACYIVIYK